MYAVYGLSEDKESIETFIGYIPATFFSNFTNPELWTVKTLDLPDGTQRIGRLSGRAFFAAASQLRANIDEIKHYMGDAACQEQISADMIEF